MQKKYEVVIGLEVHVHLATKSKLFCSCSTVFGAPPNSNVCEICSGMPGALPTPNREAIRIAALVGLATNCKINQVSRFARKNYFYPDLPNGYQISQFELPICEHGYIEIGDKNIGITRIHMENDAGKNIHVEDRNISLVDLNRAGVPLIEIVSEPDMRSSEEAVQYLKNLHTLVTYLGASDGNMEEGSFRCDANVSIRTLGETRLGTRTELKNLNSFKNVQRAIDYEIERQISELESGRKIIQETRLYDAYTNETHSMRNKEEAEDYRYFPDPDLLPVEITDSELQELEKSLPELPEQRCARFMDLASLGKAEAMLLVQNRAIADFFENASRIADPKKVASLLLGPAARICNSKNIPFNPDKWQITPETVAEIVNLTNSGVISSKIAADIFPAIFSTGIKPSIYIEENGLSQMSDSSSLEKIIDGVISSNPREVASYRGGKTKLIAFFVGQVMKETKGKANPAMVNELLTKKLQRGG